MCEPPRPKGPTPEADQCLDQAIKGERILAVPPGQTITGADARFVIVAANRLAGPAGCMVEFEGWTINGDVNLKGISGLGHLGLVRCDMDSTLDIEFADLRGLDLSGSHVAALKGMRARIRGSVYLKRWDPEANEPGRLASRPFYCRRGVDLSGAWIEGTLSCRGSVLDFDRAELPEEEWTGYWTAHFPFEPVARKDAPRPYDKPFCLNLRHTTIGSTLYIGPKHAHDEKDERGGCEIRGSVDLSGLRVREFVDGLQTYRHMLEEDNDRGRPTYRRTLNRHRLVLDGLEYERFGSRSPHDAPFRLAWLELQPNFYLPGRWPGRVGDFHPQPYEQLAKVLKAMGHDGAAKEIQYRRRQRQTLHALDLQSGPARGLSKVAADESRTWHKIWKGLLPLRKRAAKAYGWVTGFGYRPGNLLGCIFGLVLLNTAMVHVAAGARLVTPSKEAVSDTAWWRGCRDARSETHWFVLRLTGAWALNECLQKAPANARSPAIPVSEQKRFEDYPRFNALFLSIESFFPVLDLNQRAYWRVSDRSVTGLFLSWWMAIYTMLGWIGTSLLVAGLFARFNQRGGD